MTKASQFPVAPPWGDIKISGRRIKEYFYTQVEPPANAESDQPFFRCRCGKLRIQSLRHGYTNLKQHVIFKHPAWVLEQIDDLQATPPSSPVREKTSRAKGKAKAKASDETPATDNSLSPLVAPVSSTTNRKKRKSNASAEVAVDLNVADEGEEEASGRPAPARRSRQSTSGSSAAAASQTVKKRDGYILWDEYFMSVAFLSAMRSKDPSTQVGACIVNSEKKIVGIGYNGFPNGCSDNTLPWSRESSTNDPLETKYPFVCHAEMNAILNKNSSDLKGCTIYVALFPCNECAKLIIQSGITHIVFLSDKYHDDWKMVASRRMLDMAGVHYRQHHVSNQKIVIDFSTIA